VQNVFDMRENVEAGVRHLRDLVDLYRGNLAFSLAAYNAGADAVARHGGIPPYAETQAYVARILRLLQEAGVPTSADAASGRGISAAVAGALSLRGARRAGNLHEPSDRPALAVDSSTARGGSTR
jgi:hypothetical protein